MNEVRVFETQGERGRAVVTKFLENGEYRVEWHTPSGRAYGDRGYYTLVQARKVAEWVVSEGTDATAFRWRPCQCDKCRALGGGA